MASSFRDRADWLRPVLKNGRFWMSLAGLFAAFMFFVLLLNFAIMPLWTRHDAAIEVPEVRQLQADEAAGVLEQAGLRPERREQPFNPNLPADIVVDQTPLPNSSVKPGRRIYYYVNASPREMVAVPDVAGMAEGVAKAELQDVGLLIGDIHTDTLRTPFEGTVTRHTPPAGSAVPQGTRVTLWLSPGLGGNQVRVPDVTDLPPDQARAVLFEAGLWVSTSTRGDTIRWQEPRAGNRLREGSEVKIHTTQPPEGWNPPPAPLREPTADPSATPAPAEPEAPVEPETQPETPPEELPPPPNPAPPPQDEGDDEANDGGDG